MDWLSERGWEVLNGCTEGDWEGEFTYVGAMGCSVIDYVVVNERIGNRIRRFRIGNRVDWDHMPLELIMEMKSREGHEKRIQRQGRKKMKEIEMIIWNQEAKEAYAERTDEMCKQTRVERRSWRRWKKNGKGLKG